jgi:hypothetical protein
LTIGHGPAGRFERDLEIAEDLLELRLEIARADQLAGRIARSRPDPPDRRSSRD